MKVSIITVCFNSAATLADTFRSIAQQDYPQIEHIVVDGASTDGTVALIKQHETQIARWISEPDKGIYDAMNKGLAMATGDIMGILNSDDMLATPHSISQIVAAFREQPNGCVYGDLVYVKRQNTQQIVRYWKAGKGTSRKFYFGWMPPHPTFYISRTVLEQCGYYDLRFPVAADYEYMLRVMVKHGVPASYVPKVLVKMRLGGHSNQSVNSRKRSYFENHQAWRVNGLKPYFFTVWLKIARKFKQYFVKP
jgi:glycosyltransferase